MDNGTAAHKRWNRNLKRAGLLYDHDVRLTVLPGGPVLRKPKRGEKPLWSGELDVLLQRSDDPKVIYIGDIKTSNRFIFAKVPDQDLDFDVMARKLVYQPASRYLASYPRQLLQYVAMFRRHWAEVSPPGSPEISRDCCLLFENTDDQTYEIRWFRLSDKLEEEVFKVAREAQAATDEGYLLEPPYARQSQTCRECYREDICYKIQEGEEDACQSLTKALAKAGSSRTPQLA